MNHVNSTLSKFIIGIDSTDSDIGGCTTWTALRVLRKLSNKISGKAELYLIRLNPNVPTKTRGNAAVKLVFKSYFPIKDIRDIIVYQVKTDFERFNQNHTKSPGVAILVNKKPDQVLYEIALQEIITIDKAINLQPVNYLWPKGSEGLIGALAAVSAEFTDFTYELLSYREEENFGKSRKVILEQVLELTNKFPSTFGSYHRNRALIAPTGADPVLVGIRGEDKTDLEEFLKGLDLEKISDKAVFITNQGTNAHVKNWKAEIIPHHVISSDVIIIEKPIILTGGHVKLMFRIVEDDITGMAFEPTKSLAKKAMDLTIGDRIFVHGAVGNNEHGLYISLEYFEIIDLIKKEKANPICNDCKKIMTSAGFLDGYKCRKCENRSYIPRFLETTRSFYIGEKIYAAISAQRHLTRPLQRIHKNNKM